jgi:hypothetical protein
MNVFWVTAILWLPFSRKRRRTWPKGDRYRLKGYDFDHLLGLVANLYGLDKRDIVTVSKQPLRVQARSLLCYWAVRKLGFSVTSVAAKLGMTQPAGSRAVQRGEAIANEKDYQLESKA